MMHLERSQSAAVLEKAASEFVDWRPRIGVAYRILGSAEAETSCQRSGAVADHRPNRRQRPVGVPRYDGHATAINVAQSASRREAPSDRG